MTEPDEMTDEEFDDAQAQTHASGIQYGMLRVIAHIRAIAGMHFQNGDDRVAKMFRAMAEELGKQAEKVYTAPDPQTGAPWQGEGKPGA